MITFHYLRIHWGGGVSVACQNTISPGLSAQTTTATEGGTREVFTMVRYSELSPCSACVQIYEEEKAHSSAVALPK